ncbi:MAG TPA: Bax inhibitor-1 family protein, partial [Gemmatimonadaceae bacterium]|nr:Bax inhibitor-1 family protein [Gemmatimonadaceae bacterium]
MGVSYQTGTLVRTGEERATLVRRTYSLVLVSVLVTMVGATFGLSQPRVMQAVAAHPFISFLAVMAPLLLATRAKAAFPMNIGLVLLFTFAEGVFISPMLYVYGQRQPGIIMQAAILTIGAFGVLTAYAFVSRRDFSAWGSFLMVGLWVLIGTMVLNFFFRNELASLWLAAVTVLLF